MLRICVFATLFLLATAIEIPFQLCDGLPDPTSVSIPEFADFPCDIQTGDSFTLNFNILTTRRVGQLLTSVTLLHNGEEFNFPLPTGDACNVLVANNCPLETGEYTLSFPVILEGVPLGSSRVTVSITDEDLNGVACANVEAFINP